MKFWTRLVCAVMGLGLGLTIEPALVEAANVVRYVGQLVKTPDNRYDESCPTGNCAPTTVAWSAGLTTAMAVVASQTTGTATDIDLSAYCSGSNCASAVYRLHTAVTNWSVAGSGTKHLLHAGVATGSSAVSGALVLDVCYPSAPTCNSSASFNWSYTAPAPSDSTPPTFTTGILNDSTGVGTVTISATPAMDPNDAVQRSGIASYKFYRNGVLADTLTAPSAGLICDFAGTSIGSPGGSLSITQGSGSTGAQWTVVGGGFGVQNADEFYGAFCPVSGPTVDIVDKIDTLPNTLTYNKSHSDIRNSPGTSSTEVHFDCVLMRIGSTYYMQPTYRLAAGGNNTTGSLTTLPGSPPYYRHTSLAAGKGACEYSTDGGAWTSVLSNISISFADSKIAGVGVSATTSGADSANITAIFSSVGVSTSARVSDTLTVAAGSATFTVAAADVTGNIGTVVGSVTATPGAPPSTQVKFHQGNYVWEGTVLTDSLTLRLAATQSYITSTCANANIKGYQLAVMWHALEGNTLGDYSDGFSGVDTLLTQIGGCSKYFMLVLNWSSFGSPVSSQPACPSNVSSYLCSTSYGACCTGTSGSAPIGPDYTLGGVVLPTGNGGVKTTIRMWDSRVADRVIALFQAYCGRYDGNNTFEMIGLGGETAQAAGTTDYNAAVTQYGRILDAAAVACPHTMIRLPLNFVGTDTQMQALVAKCASEPNCIIGGPDPLYSGTLHGLATGYAVAERVWSGVQCTGCTPHDYSANVAWVTETQAALIDNTTIGGIYIGGGTPTSNCPTTVSRIRADSEGAVQNARDLIWVKFVACYDPNGGSSPTGIIDSINATPTIMNNNCPPNFPACKTN